MTVKILLSGFFYPEDLAYLENAQDLRVVHYPKLNSIPDMPAFLREAAHADLVILALFGSNLDEMFVRHFSSREALRVLNDRFRRKVLWSMDSHIWREMEARYQFFFDRYYLAHSPYLSGYKDVECRWLPCCCYQEAIDEHLRRLREPPPLARDLVFPYMTHPHGERNQIAAAIQERLARRNLKVHFGYVGMGAEYSRAIQESRICLNISLADDLNVRNFEVWGLNRCLLANPVPDHGLIEADFGGTVFFQRDLSDFDAALEAALRVSEGEIHSAGVILNRHMLIHRYVEIINGELGTNYRVSEIPVPGAAAGHGGGESWAEPSSRHPAVASPQTALDRLRRVHSADWQADLAASVLQTESLARAGKYQDALTRLSPHLADRPDDPGLLALKATLLTLLGEFEMARREYVKAMTLAPGSAVAPAGLAALQMLYLGRLDEAEASVQRALALEPANRQALALLVSLVLLSDRQGGQQT